MSRLKCISPSRGFMAVYADGSKKVCPNEIERRSAVEFVDIDVPCRKCIACQHNYGLDWGNRAFHECQTQERSSFLSLSYRDAPPAFVQEDVVKFFKRLRMVLQREGMGTLRYMVAGERGDRTNRVHYHSLIFGQDFSEWRELVLPGKEPSDRIYRCDRLEKIWGHGFVDLREVTVDRCLYVAMHSVKAFHQSENADKLFLYSRKPAIGRDWVDRYHSDLLKGFSTDGQGNSLAIPSHYLKWPAHRDNLGRVREDREQYAKAITAEQKRELDKGNANKVRAFVEQLRLKALRKGAVPIKSKKPTE